MGAGIPQDKKRVRKGYSLIQLILQLKELDLFRFKEGLILPALYSPELMEDNDEQNTPHSQPEQHLQCVVSIMQHKA